PIDLRDAGFVEVEDDEQRLCREELKPAQSSAVVTDELQRSKRTAVFQRLATDGDDVAFALEVRRPAPFQIFVEPIEAPLGDGQVGEKQLLLHRLRLAGGIER